MTETVNVKKCNNVIDRRKIRKILNQESKRERER